MGCYMIEIHKFIGSSNQIFPFLGGSWISAMLPYINKLIPSSARKQPLNKHAHIYTYGEFSVMIVSPNKSILQHVIPQTDSHIVGAGS